MNIDQKYLVNNYLSENKKAFYGKLISGYETAIKEFKNNIKKDYIFKKKVLSWLFSHSVEDRMILCSVENKKYTNTIYEAYMHTKQSKNVMFCIEDNDSNDGEKYKLEMTTLDNSNISKNIFKYKEKEFWSVHNAFLDNFVFYQCESPIDDIKNYSNYFTLDYKILEDSQNFINMCHDLTDNKFLSNQIMIKMTLNNNKKFKFLELPNWISFDSNNRNDNLFNYNYNQNNRKYFSLTQIMLGLIEQALSVRYILYYTSNNLNELLESTYLYDLFKKKEQILEYLDNNSIEPKKFYSELNIADIYNKIFHDKKIESFIMKKKSYLLNLGDEGKSVSSFDNFNNDNKKTNTYDSKVIFEKLVEENKNNNSQFYKNIIELSMFFHINKLYTLDDFFFRLISEKIIDYYENIMLDDLIKDEAKTKKKKKKKKKNNKKKDNDIKEEANLENEQTNNINENNIDYEKEKETIYNFVKNLILDNISKKLNEKFNNDIINNKKSKKNKGFFLYEPVKKNEKKNPNNKSNK